MVNADAYACVLSGILMQPALQAGLLLVSFRVLLELLQDSP